MSTLLSDLKGYQIIGKHSAVRTCLWLKKSMKDMGVCYKQKFYGINSHRCLQMTPALLCNMNCIHCWRPLKLMPKDEIKSWDPPNFIYEEAVKAQHRLLSGFHGTDKVNGKKLEEAYKPNQVAVSLIGEPTLYPYLDELIDIFNSKNMTTFVVTNGSNPEMIQKIHPFQLYISLTAYSEESHKKLNRPGKSHWDKIKQSLKLIGEKERSVIRLTLIKGVNMDPENYAPLLEMASPTYVEAKAYMHLGYSRKRLNADAMPEHNEVEAFSNELSKLTGYKVENSSEISRVVLLKRD